MEEAVLPVTNNGNGNGKNGGAAAWWRSWRVSSIWAEIDTKHVDIPLLATCFCAGLTDSTLYNGLFALFVSVLFFFLLLLLFFLVLLRGRKTGRGGEQPVVQHEHAPLSSAGIQRRHLVRS